MKTICTLALYSVALWHIPPLINDALDTYKARHKNAPHQWYKDPDAERFELAGYPPLEVEREDEESQQNEYIGADL